MRPPARLFLSVALAATLALSAALSTAPPSSAAIAAGPMCVPEALDAPALLDGAVTVSPMPGARDASAQTQISFLGVPASELSAVSVTGSRSGGHRGALQAYSQGNGASFVPATVFQPGEVVTVSAQLTLTGGTPTPLTFHFTVADEDPLSTTPAVLHALAAGSDQQFLSRPDLRPPAIAVHVSTSGQAPGDLFLAPYGVPAQAGPMILDPAGKLVWFEPLAPHMQATNLRVQQLDGAPVLTWWQGTITVHGFGIGLDVIAGNHYQTIAEVRAGNGAQADLHEFQITPARTALLTAYRAVHCNLAALGGPADGAVTDSLFQEIDIRTGLVIYQWDSLDHVALSSSYSPTASTSVAAPFDFFHLNSISLDPDGTLLISSRNTWAADDIDPRTGQLLWTLGGKHSSFTEGAGAPTAYQHDARQVAPGVFSLFDNGASPQAHAQSRGVVLDVNAQTHDVSVAAQFLHAGNPLLADSQGDMQALPNGDWFVGWGQEPDLSEFSPAGAMLFDARLPSGYESYRALRFQWDATPLHPPALTLADIGATGAVAYVSWNGATQVAHWELRVGHSQSTLARYTVVAKTGFETAIAVRSGRAPRYLQARALDASGAVIGSSAVVVLPGRGIARR
jgi:Arylsulfotransferase (ASST)